MSQARPPHSGRESGPLSWLHVLHRVDAAPPRSHAGCPSLGTRPARRAARRVSRPAAGLRPAGLARAGAAARGGRADPSTGWARAVGGKGQIPSDLVVKSQPIDIAEVIFHRSGEKTSSKRRVDTGKHGLSGSPHLRTIGLPRNPMECGKTCDTTADHGWRCRSVQVLCIQQGLAAARHACPAQAVSARDPARATAGPRRSREPPPQRQRLTHVA